MKKLMALALAALMVFSLVACGPSEGGDPTPTPGGSNAGGDQQTNTKTFQFWGKYEEAGEYASMLASAFLLNLNEDGTAVADKYAPGSYDASPAASNSSFTASYMSGTWKEVEKDSVPCLQIKLAYIDEAGNESNAITEYVYDVAGVYSFDLTFPVVPGQAYTRQAAMEGKEGKTYADADAFIQAFKQEFVAPESIAALTDAEKNGTAYIQEGGTILVYAGYDKFAEGTWTLGMTGLTINVNGTDLAITMDGTKASFVVARDMAGYGTIEYTFTIDDITTLAGHGAAAGGEEPAGDDQPAAEGIATYNAGGLQLILLDETNMKVTFPQYGMERDGFTYTLEGNTLTVTSVPGEEAMGAFGQIWSAMGAEKWTIDGNTATKAE